MIPCLLLVTTLFPAVSSAQWVQLGPDIDGEWQDDYSGYCVALSSDGSHVAVGAPSNDGNGSDSGHVRVYRWFSPNWIRVGSDIDGEAADDGSGWSVALSSDGSRVAIGAPKNDGNGTDSGHVRVYEWVSAAGEWVQLGPDIDGDGHVDAVFANKRYETDHACLNDGTGVFTCGAVASEDTGSSAVATISPWYFIFSDDFESADTTEWLGTVP